MYFTDVKDPYWFAKGAVLFEKYIMALKRDKYSIEIQKDDAIQRNRLFFDFMLRMFNNLN